jgi:NAD(P)-dependent dehydrogenase (short-subunit alcohol dehydrogenase family)
MALDGKVALITGAAGGIGLAIALRYAADGAKVVLSDVQEAQGHAAADALAAAGFQAIFIRCDTSNEADVEALVDAAEKAYGGVDVAVCSAGIAKGTGPFHQTSAADFERTLKINLVGPFLLGKAVANRMLAAGRKGTIIHISSVGAVLGVADSPAYCVSKAGLGMLTKTMALALAPHGIRVNAIGPGPTITPMTAALDEEAVTRMLMRTPLGRFGEADEMAGVAAFLAGADASYITGQTIYADGGRLALNYTMPPKPAAAS